MSDLPASHYLGIYEHRLSMSDRGVTQPSPQVTAGMKRLVAALRALRPEEEVALDATTERAIFSRSSNGELIARIDFDAPNA
jgi:hypothetical protein